MISPQYYVTDPHGNVVQLTDENGKVVRTYEYDSFGNEVKPDSKDDNLFRYCGEYYDKETGEVYLRARYYQPKVGRFLTRDTYTGEEDDPLSLHLYTYCGNDGVNAWDPSGHYIDTIEIYDKSLELYRQLSQADGPYPFGDAAGGVIVTGASVLVLGEAVYTWYTDSHSNIDEDIQIKPYPGANVGTTSGIQINQKLLSRSRIKIKRKATLILKNPLKNPGRITSQIRIYKKRTAVTGSQKVYIYELKTKAMTLRSYSTELQKILLRAQKEAKKEEKGKKRSKNPPARRQKYNSKKEAYQAAKRVGKGKEPIHHPNDPGQRPHYHPNVSNNQRLTPKNPSSHDHYYYPRR